MLAVPFAHAGPIARSVADAALMLGVMAGPDDRDPYSLPADRADYMGATRRSVAGLRVAWSPDLGVFPIDPEVARVTKEAVRRVTMENLPKGEDLVRLCYGSADFKEGVHAFLAKRPPEWRGT